MTTGDAGEHVTFDEEAWKLHIVDQVGRLEQEVSRAGLRTADDAMSGMKDAISRDASLAFLFDRKVWGQIVWRKAVGQPNSARMADAFTIVHQYEELEWVITASGSSKSIGRIVDGAAPRLWDGPHDEDHFRVSYMLQGVHPWMNGIGVSLRTDVSWSPSSPPWLRQQRRIQYPPSLQPLGTFLVKESGITYLDDIEVVRLFS